MKIWWPTKTASYAASSELLEVQNDDPEKIDLPAVEKQGDEINSAWAARFAGDAGGSKAKGWAADSGDIPRSRSTGHPHNGTVSAFDNRAHPRSCALKPAASARRIGGNDKARIRIGGATMLERVVACLVPQCSQVILNANGDPSRFAEVDLRVVTDGISGFPGPLAGILAGLDWTADHAPQIEWIVSAPSDCPFLPPDLVARLHRARIEADSRLACAVSAQRRHPVVALWPLDLRSDLRRALVSEGARKVESWIARYSPVSPKLHGRPFRLTRSSTSIPRKTPRMPIGLPHNCDDRQHTRSGL